MTKFFLYIPYLSLALVLSSCSSAPSVKKEERPQWIATPLTACQNNMEICVVGEGKTLTDSQAESRRSMALVFEAKVSGEKNFYKTVDQKGAFAVSQSESMQTELHEATDEILKGVVIKFQYFDEERQTFYSLASLDRFNASNEIKKHLQSIDEEIYSLKETKSHGSYRKMVDLYEKRQLMASRYEFIRGVSYPMPLELKDIYEQKKNLKEESVAVKWTHKEEAQELAPFIAQILTDNHYKLVAEGEEKEWLLKADLEEKQIPLNVQGFERYVFTLHLTFYNDKGVKVLVFEKTLDETGRGRDQIKQKAFNKFKDILLEEWKYLSLSEK